VGAVDLRVELTDHAGEENHRDAGSDKGIDHPIGESPQFDAVIAAVASSGELHGEDDEDHHKLASQKVTIQVIALVDGGSAHVRLLMCLPVELGIDGPETNEGTLPSFYHRQPKDG